LPDLPDPAHRRVLTGHLATLFTVTIAPDGRWLAAGSGDQTVRIWDAAIDSDDDTVRIWDVATGLARVTLTCRGIVNAVAIAPDGRRLATADGSWAVRVWDTATGQVEATLPGRYGGVYLVALTPDGRWLAAARSAG
jgi:WD40 repeat protein